MLRECPYCAEKIQKRARVCRFCSAKVDPFYVENAQANKQICRIMALHFDGNSADEVAKKLNDSGELTLDSKEPWTVDRIQTVVASFSGENKQQSSGTPEAPRNLSTSGNFRTEQRKCFCPKCNISQDEVVSFIEGQCNHILHAIITFLTGGLWGIVWLIIFISSQNETKRNRRVVISEKRCDQCGGHLIPMNE